MIETVDAQELDLVRKKLDALNSQRLSGPFDLHTLRVYEGLCRIEAALLHEREPAK